MRLVAIILGLSAAQVFAGANHFTISSGNTLTFRTVAPGSGATLVNPGAAGGGTMTITGPILTNYQITSIPTTATLTSGTHTLSVTGITPSPTSPNGATNALGTATLNIGGTLAAVPNGQVAGNPYTGTIAVTIRDAGSTGPSASANLTIQAIIPQEITITKVADLAFGQGVQGDPAVTITAGNAGSASFTVGGNASASYTITLPATTVNMTTGSGTPPNQVIAVTSFTSSPANTGVLTAGGTQTLYVGATRAALLAAQTAGSYTGTFTVTVNY